MTNGTTNGHGNDSDEQDTNETFENDAERIMSKRGKKSKNSADYQSEEEQTSSASNEVTENLNDSLEVEKKPIISIPNEILEDLEAEKSLPSSNRRRIAFTVVQSVPSPIPPPFKRRLTRSTTPKNSEDELEVDNEISFVNGKVDTSGFLSTIHDSPSKVTIKEELVESKTETPSVESTPETPAVESTLETPAVESTPETPDVESSAEEEEVTPMELATPIEVPTSPKVEATSPKVVDTSPRVVVTYKEVATLREVEVVTPMEVTAEDKPEEATPEVKASEVEVTLEEPKIKETLVKVETVPEEENESIQQSLANSLIEGIVLSFDFKSAFGMINSRLRTEVFFLTKILEFRMLLTLEIMIFNTALNKTQNLEAVLASLRRGRIKVAKK